MGVELGFVLGERDGMSLEEGVGSNVGISERQAPVSVGTTVGTEVGIREGTIDG